MSLGCADFSCLGNLGVPWLLMRKPLAPYEESGKLLDLGARQPFVTTLSHRFNRRGYEAASKR